VANIRQGLLPKGEGALPGGHIGEEKLGWGVHRKEKIWRRGWTVERFGIRVLNRMQVRHGPQFPALKENRVLGLGE